jgi:hypothetical protein
MIWNQEWIKMIRNQKVSYAIFLFFIAFSLFHFFLKPSITYYPDGSFRPFGLEYTDETFLPIWLVSLVLGIFSYLFILFVCSVPPPASPSSAIRSLTKRYRRT